MSIMLLPLYVPFFTDTSRGWAVKSLLLPLAYHDDVEIEDE